ncbi:coiled-coil domain-containing protein 42 like-2-like isoform X1 [Lagopus muta]|uniref:coiled-coil domain-containing protein 42 like-2-like isoform X1 n=1 Tax=Lagopus muta TaxID=64668 RepID=UPI00209DC4C0|nr:coiled-coil domain-containing protein 42 like-2-like isoform X1 [Lagopus muta]
MAAPRPAPLLPPLAAQDPDAVPKMSLGLEEHLSRAFQDKLRFQKVPTWDSASLLPSRRLLLKRREVVEVEQALQAQREFQDVPSMLAHFGALMEAQAVLLRQVEAGQVALAQGRAQLQQCCEEADGELTSSNEKVLQLRARLEAARRDVLKGESRWAQLEGAAAQKTLLLGQIRMAVLSLFQLATTRLEVPKDVALGDTEAQLDVVSVAQQPRGWKGCGCPCDTEAPMSPAAALHAGPGCHLCRAGAASSCACHHCHTLTASQGCRCASQPQIVGLRTQ